MSEKKKRHFPADRLKLHALLDKREQDLVNLQDELEELRAEVKSADQLAIVNTAEEFHVTPEEFAQFVAALRTGEFFPEMPGMAETTVTEEKEAEPDDSTNV